MLGIFIHAETPSGSTRLLDMTLDGNASLTFSIDEEDPQTQVLLSR